MIKESPFIMITIAIMTLYTLHNLYLFLFLQHPDAIALATAGILRPRPAVQLTDPRQVLIVGSISSGTTQVSADLKEQFGLEIGHENAESSWSFVRDGTVSWFHGIRYIPRPGIDTNEKEYKNEPEKGERLFQAVVHHLCHILRPNMGFHPFMYRSDRCSLRQKWDSCWRSECVDIVRSEWGCGLQKNSSSGASPPRSCETPFQRTLHQVRHPLRTIESLVTKFCISGVEGDVQPDFLAFASVLFPQYDFSDLSCIEAAGYYTVEYNNALIDAKDDGNLDDRFHVEEVTPCSVAGLAGFMDQDALHAPNIGKVSAICKDENSEANELMTSSKNLYNKGQLSLDWDDLLGGIHGSSKKEGDRDLQKQVKKLTQKLGYQ